MKTLKNVFSRGSIYCMVITILYTLILFIANQEQYASITLAQYISVVLFSLLLSSASLLFDIKSLPKIVVWILHYLFCSVSFLVVFIAFGNIKIDNPSQILFIYLGFSLLYAAIEGMKIGIAILAHHLLHNDKIKKEKAEKEYTPLYKS